MPTDFKILPLAPEPVPGSSLIDQVENAVNELGTQYDLLENNVVQKADQALEMAQNAEATATDALQTAQEAESKADMAQGAADRASALAKQADDSANEALDRAGSAYDMAALALSDSKEASANSQVALERAETALTQSTTATENADQAILIAQNALKTANEANGTYEVDDTIYEADTSFYTTEKKYLTNSDSTGLPAGIGFPVYMETLLNSDLTSVVQRCWSEGSPSVSIRYGSVDHSDPEDMTVAWTGWTKSGGDGSVSGSLKDSVLGAVTINNARFDIDQTVGLNGYFFVQNPTVDNLPVPRAGLLQSIAGAGNSATFQQYTTEDQDVFYRNSSSRLAIEPGNDVYDITATSGDKRISDKLVLEAGSDGEISLRALSGANFSINRLINSGLIISGPLELYISDSEFIENGFTITITDEAGNGADGIHLTVPAGGSDLATETDTATSDNSHISLHASRRVLADGYKAELNITAIWTNYIGIPQWSDWNSIASGAVANVNTRLIITESGSFTAPISGWYKATCIGGGGGGGKGGMLLASATSTIYGGFGGEAGGETCLTLPAGARIGKDDGSIETLSERTAITSEGGGGGGGAGAKSGGGGGGPGQTTITYIYLKTGQSVDVVIGHGGLGGTEKTTDYAGKDGGGTYGGKAGASHGPGGGALGAGNGLTSYQGATASIPGYGALGGTGGYNTLGYGNGGGGGGGSYFNAALGQVSGGMAGPGATSGQPGMPGGVNAGTAGDGGDGGNGGSGAVILEYSQGSMSSVILGTSINMDKTVTQSSTLIAGIDIPSDQWVSVCLIAAGGAGGGSQGRGGGQGGATSLALPAGAGLRQNDGITVFLETETTISATGGSGGAGPADNTHNQTLGGGGGGGAGEVKKIYCYLQADMPISTIIGAGGLHAETRNTSAQGPEAGRNTTIGQYYWFQGGQGGGNGETGNSGAHISNTAMAGNGGRGGSTGLGFGGGGGGIGGNAPITPGLGGRGLDGGQNGEDGTTTSTTIIYGGDGGDGAIILSYHQEA